MYRLRNKKRISKKFIHETGIALEQNVDVKNPDGAPCLFNNLEQNIALLKKAAGENPDLVVRRFAINTAAGPVSAAVLFVDGMVDSDLIGSFILKPLFEMTIPVENGVNISHTIAKIVVTVPDVKVVASLPIIVTNLVRGDTILLLDRDEFGLSCSTRGYETRTIQEPTLETVIRGPKEGFTENIRTNLTLIRRKIPNPKLRIEELWVGKYSQTKVLILYIDGIAEKSLVEEVKKRITRIEIDGVIDSGYIEQLIEDAPYSLFPTIGNTEKPDVLSSRLLEGRVGVLVDGSPVALSMPRLFYEALQSPEDYYSRPYNSSIVRIIRLLFFISTLILPGFYVALLNFHPEMIPRTLMLTIATSREGVPFPLTLEVLFFGFIFEGLREAGVRLPRPVGSAVTIVGALIIGQATIDAGLVSSSTVIITAFVGIAGFITPGMADIYIIMRFGFVVLCSFLGFYGLVAGAVVSYTHLSSLRSFGVPYTSPVYPYDSGAFRDIFLRIPLWLLKTRPSHITKQNRYRIGSNQKPGPPKESPGRENRS